MTKIELAKRLHDENFLESIFDLDGNIPAAYEGYILSKIDNRWRIEYYERGTKRLLGEFTDEGVACDWLYNKLECDPTTRKKAERNE
ncbi:MAG TPA: hypothetical protein VNI53_07445 [Gammaproteobacteria bacterium]|nr:hypothetical protein [Gammaproteobacteria bacterium]